MPLTMEYKPEDCHEPIGVVAVLHVRRNMKRREFLPFLLSPALAATAPGAFAAAESAPDMKITRIDTTHFRPGVELPWRPHTTSMWVRIYADNGLVGLGETYPRNPAEAEIVHSAVAATLLRRSAMPETSVPL